MKQLNERDITLVHLILSEKIGKLMYEIEKAKESFDHRTTKAKQKELEEVKSLLNKFTF